MNKPLCFIDMDLTMVDIDLQPYEGLEDRLKELLKKYELVCWSAGGKEYADQILRRNEIRQYFSLVLDKPFIIIDDEPDSLQRGARVVKVESRDHWAHRETFWSKVFQKEVSKMEDLCLPKYKE